MMPVQGGVRKRRNRQPVLQNAGDSTILSYSASGIANQTTTGGQYGSVRQYIPGQAYGLANSAGPSIVSYYSSGKFLPGTKLRWEPAVSFTTPGRVLVGFTDNPEVSVAITGLFVTAVSTGAPADWTAYANAVRGLGSVKSFPVWQETEVEFPTRLRRKMFDVNASATAAVDVYDRSMQTTMFAAIEGTNGSVAAGNFWYHDKLLVEGITGILT
jgi:hypothetical protein